MYLPKRKAGTDMQIKYGLTGSERKALVIAIGEILGTKPEYKGAPGFEYKIGGFMVDKDGTLSIGDDMESNLEKLIDSLAERGFEPQSGDKLTIEIPLDGFTEQSLDNLERLVASKASLIKKAIGADALPIERTETTLKFPWFESDGNGNSVDAYTKFICALCAAAKEQKRVTSTEKTVENEKFAFRVFLIRLGFIGDEYKTARKILLRNLSGNSAFKNGTPSKGEAHE